MRGFGYQVEVEKSIGDGRAIDLVARKDGREIAVEIETGASDLEENVRKCLAAGYEKVYVLASRRGLIPAIKRKAQMDRGFATNQVEVQDVRSFLQGTGGSERAARLKAGLASKS